MAIKTSAGFEHRGKEPHFADQQFKTKAELKAYPEYDISEGLIAYCLEDGNNYQWKSTNPERQETGKWSVLSTGGASLPPGGKEGQGLIKASDLDDDAKWGDLSVDFVFHEDTQEIEVFGGAGGGGGHSGAGLPTGGYKGQIIVKQSANDGDADWEDGDFVKLENLVEFDLQDILNRIAALEAKG